MSALAIATINGLLSRADVPLLYPVPLPQVAALSHHARSAASAAGFYLAAPASRIGLLCASRKACVLYGQTNSQSLWLLHASVISTLHMRAAS